jgi:hypothetical protein
VRVDSTVRCLSSEPWLQAEQRASCHSDSLDRYMLKEKTWGGHVEIQTFARAWARPVRAFMYDENFAGLISTDCQPGEDTPMEQWGEQIDLFNFEGHYWLLRPLQMPEEGANTQPAEDIPDPAPKVERELTPPVPPEAA